MVFHCYIHAPQSQGYFSFDNAPATLTEEIAVLIAPHLIISNYSGSNTQNENANSHAGEGLQKPGYVKGRVAQTETTIRYHQPTYNGHYYEVLVQWKKLPGSKIIRT